RAWRGRGARGGAALREREVSTAHGEPQGGSVASTEGRPVLVPETAAGPSTLNGLEPPAPLPTHDEPGAATINTSATVYANPRKAAETPRVGETETPRVPQQVPPRPRRFLRAAAFGVGGLAAAAVIFYVLPKLSSH